MSEASGTATHIPSCGVDGDWADLSAVPGVASCWVDNAIVATDGGEVIGFHAAQLVAFDGEGHLFRTVDTGYIGADLDAAEQGWRATPGWLTRSLRTAVPRYPFCPSMIASIPHPESASMARAISMSLNGCSAGTTPRSPSGTDRYR